MILRALLLFHVSIHVVSSTRVSLTDSPSYSSMRPCVRSCFGNRDVNWLAQNLDCSNTNECICRADIQPLADNRIKSCVGTYCKDSEVDISSAVAVYNTYCTEAGYRRDGVVATAATTTANNNANDAGSQSSPTTSAGLAPLTEAPQTTPAASRSTASNLPVQTSPSSSNNTGQAKSSGVSTETTTIIVSVIGTVFTAIGVGVAWYYGRKMWKERERKRREGLS